MFNLTFEKKNNFSSHDANRVQQEKEEKLNHLEQRRNRLAAILEAEKTKFQVKKLFYNKFQKRNLFCILF